MKKDWTELEPYRVQIPYPSNPGDPYGAFMIPLSVVVVLFVIATDGEGGITDQAWEHVSVHVQTIGLDLAPKKRTPTWEEMCIVKRLFWEPDECVVQYHPPESDYVNISDSVLHLWRPRDPAISIPMPPQICV